MGSPSGALPASPSGEPSFGLSSAPSSSPSSSPSSAPSVVPSSSPSGSPSAPPSGEEEEPACEDVGGKFIWKVKKGNTIRKNCTWVGKKMKKKSKFCKKKTSEGIQIRDLCPETCDMC